MMAMGLGLSMPAITNNSTQIASPAGPDFLFVDSGIGGWYQSTPLSKLKELSDGTGAVASPGDLVGYWTSWNSVPIPITQTTTGNKPSYDGSAVLFDASGANDKYLLGDMAVPSARQKLDYFVYAVRVVPKADGDIIIGANIAIPTAKYGIRLAPGGAISAYNQANGRTHGSTWAVDTPIAIAIIGNGEFGSTNMYVNNLASALGMFTSSVSDLTTFGILASEGSFQVEKAVFMNLRTSAISNAEIDDLFTYLSTSP